MPDFHRLDAQADAPFLRRDVVDPLSRVSFRPTNAVALCATCGLVSLRETWEACGGCPNGHPTAATWDAALAARSSGDGARTPAPRPVAPPPPAPRPPAPPVPFALPPADPVGDELRSRTGLWIALGVGALLLAALAVWVLLNRGDDPVAVPQATVAGPTAPTAVVLAAGDTAATLTDRDFRSAEGYYQDLYTFAADSSGRALAFTVESEAFYPAVVVTAPDGTETEAETVGDGEGDVRRVAVRNLRGPGLFRVLVSSRRRAATGAYTLAVRQDEPVIALAPGRQASGTFTVLSPKADGKYRDTYSFTGAVGREHTLTVRSGAFTPAVTVTGPAGAILATSAPTSGGIVLRFTPDRAGTYRTVVSTVETNRTGAYTVLLAVAPAPPVAAPAASAPREVETAGSLRAGGAPVRDSLAAGAQKTYGASGRIGDRITVEVRAVGFTPTLTIIGPDGQRTPAMPDGDRARARVTLPADGRFRVVVGSTGGEGTFSVSLEAQAAVTAAPIPRLPGADLPRPVDPPPAPPAPDPQDPTYRPQPLGGNNQDAP